MKSGPYLGVEGAGGGGLRSIFYSKDNKVVLWTFSIKLFRNNVAIVFDHTRPTFDCIFSSKGLYMTRKIEVFVQQYARLCGLRCNFDHFSGQKSHFLDFYKVVLGVFKHSFETLMT